MHLSDIMLAFKESEQKQTLTQQRRDKSNNTIEFSAREDDKNLKDERLTSYLGHIFGFSVHCIKDNKPGKRSSGMLSLCCIAEYIGLYI